MTPVPLTVGGQLLAVQDCLSSLASDLKARARAGGKTTGAVKTVWRPRLAACTPNPESLALAQRNTPGHPSQPADGSIVAAMHTRRFAVETHAPAPMKNMPLSSLSSSPTHGNSSCVDGAVRRWDLRGHIPNAPATAAIVRLVCIPKEWQGPPWCMEGGVRVLGFRGSSARQEKDPVTAGDDEEKSVGAGEVVFAIVL
ncbi:hypothetical protein CEK25_004615 [Fusarium fujikuroi]|nr:hypothetical protein CEK25_004615 [Fusarium fujikuroi]